MKTTQPPLQTSRARLLLVALVTLTSALGACATTSQETVIPKDEDPKVMHRPPENAPMPSMPAGPPVLGPDGKPLPRSAAATGPTSQPGRTGTVSRHDLELLMKRGPAYVFQVVSLRPARDNGNFKGYRIAYMAPEARDAITPALAIGDVITHVNGVAMRSPDDYFQAWSMLRDVKQIRLDFTREDKAEHVVWSVTTP